MSRSTVPEAYPVPAWMQSIHYTLDPLGYMSGAEKRSGKIFNAPVIGKHKQLFFVSDPAAVKQIFMSDTKEIFSPSNRLLSPIVGDRSIFAMENERHRRERKLIMPPFQRDHVPSYGKLIVRLTERLMQALQPGETFVARHLTQEISLEVILQVVFGLEDNPKFQRLNALITELTEIFRRPLVALALFQPILQKDLGPNSPWGHFLVLKKQIGEILYEEIRDRRQQPDSQEAHDILSLLIRATDDQGQSLSDEELHDELMTLLIAGHETTATTIAWALYWIHRDRNIYQNLMAELDGAASDPMAVMNLPYLNAVCSETLRIYPVAVLTVPRETRDSIELMGHHISPGTRLYAAIYLLHHNPDLYPDPEQFKPERFLDHQYSNFEFIPFGGGSRRCIGEVLALFELKLVLATMLKASKFALMDEQPEIPKRRGVTLAPGRGVLLSVQP